jgi:hypothetical protein
MPGNTIGLAVQGEVPMTAYRGKGHSVRCGLSPANRALRGMRTPYVRNSGMRKQINSAGKPRQAYVPYPNPEDTGLTVYFTGGKSVAARAPIWWP